MAFDLREFLKKWTNIGQLVGFTGFVTNSAKQAASDFGQYQTAIAKAKEGGATDEELKKLTVATMYDKMEQEGKSPDDFWAGVPQSVRDELEYSPEALRASMGRTKFLGIASAFAFAAAIVAGGFSVARGVPILLSTLARLRDARAAGAGATALMTIIEEGKIAGLAKVWLPALVAGIATAGGWLTSGLTNNLNDAFLWGRIFLGQAADDFEKAANKRDGSGGGSDSSTTEAPARTRITISRTMDPKVAVGTLFQGIVKSTEAFKRVVDDQITSAEDLKTDVVLNMNKWLATLPGRLHYEIRVVLNPLDEDGNKKLGTWVVLMIGHRNSQGVFQHLQAIPLGPIEPTIYRPTSKEIETIQLDIPRILTAEEIINLDIPTTSLRTVDNKGNVTPIQFKETQDRTSKPSGEATDSEPTPTTTDGTATRAFVRFLGSPDVFFRVDGKYLPQDEAVAKRVNLVTDVEQISKPRPEVKAATDYATWSGKDLTRFPVPVGGFPLEQTSTTIPAAAAAPLAFGSLKDIYITYLNGVPEVVAIPNSPNVPFNHEPATIPALVGAGIDRMTRWRDVMRNVAGNISAGGMASAATAFNNGGGETGLTTLRLWQSNPSSAAPISTLRAIFPVLVNYLS